MATIPISADCLRRDHSRPDGKGGYFITLPHDVLHKLNYLREAAQSYNDVILALAK